MFACDAALICCCNGIFAASEVSLSPATEFATCPIFVAFSELPPKVDNALPAIPAHLLNDLAGVWVAAAAIFLSAFSKLRLALAVFNS